MAPSDAPRNPARRIVLAYVLAAAAWILLSDRAVALLAPDLRWATKLSILKGWAFVGLTALLLFHFIRRSFQEELRIRQGLAASEARFARAFRSSPSPLAITREADGLFLDANESFCRLMAFPLPDLLGRRALDLGLYRDPSERTRLMDALRLQGRVRDQDVRLQTRTGEPLDVLASIERIDLDGETCILTAFHDVTTQKRHEAERRRLEAEVQHIHKLESLGTLAGGVAHDMNNILGAVMGVASLVQERHQGDPRLVRDMDTLLRAAARGRDLVKGLTDFARRDVQEARPTDLNEILSREAELLRRTTRQRIEVELDLQTPLPLIQGDAGALSNALMNLCVNAVDAMPSGGRLRLSSRVPGPAEVEIEVSDSGTGMPPEVLQHAMDPFFTTKAQGQGTGLGLALAYGIVKAHQGHMDLWSEVGRGTRVRMRFPSAPVLQPADTLPPEEHAPPPRPREILLVDDDELLRSTVPAMLASMGHRVAVAASGPEALAQLEAGDRPDLVILDLNMPGMDGLAVLERLRRLDSRLPVLVATGLKDERLEGRLRADPALGYLPKPFTLPELRRRVAEQVEG